MSKYKVIREDYIEVNLESILKSSNVLLIEEETGVLWVTSYAYPQFPEYSVEGFIIPFNSDKDLEDIVLNTKYESEARDSQGFCKLSGMIGFAHVSDYNSACNFKSSTDFRGYVINRKRI